MNNSCTGLGERDTINDGYCAYYGCEDDCVASTTGEYIATSLCVEE